MNFFSWSVYCCVNYKCMCIYIYTHTHAHVWAAYIHTYIRVTYSMRLTIDGFFSINAFLVIYRIRLLSLIFFMTWPEKRERELTYAFSFAKDITDKFKHCSRLDISRNLKFASDGKNSFNNKSHRFHRIFNYIPYVTRFIWSDSWRNAKTIQDTLVHVVDRC